MQVYIHKYTLSTPKVKINLQVKEIPQRENNNFCRKMPDILFADFTNGTDRIKILLYEFR